ncbi:MAG: N-acetyltransferase [Elusimicrobiota bacterium]
MRKARISDAQDIYKLIHYYANKRLMLARSLSEIYENIQGFFVIEKNKRIIGCCALHVTWEDLAEIKSLAVSPRYARKGYGTLLLKESEKEARQLGVKRLFALTFIPSFFRKNKFKETTREKLPHKIWIECVRCVYFPNCKEIPLIKKL